MFLIIILSLIGLDTCLVWFGLREFNKHRRTVVTDEGIVFSEEVNRLLEMEETI